MRPIDREPRGGEEAGNEAKAARGTRARDAPPNAKVRAVHRACEVAAACDPACGTAWVFAGGPREPGSCGMDTICERDPDRKAYFETVGPALIGCESESTTSTR